MRVLEYGPAWDTLSDAGSHGEVISRAISNKNEEFTSKLLEFFAAA